MNLAEGLAGDWYLPFNGKTIHQEVIKAGHVWPAFYLSERNQVAARTRNKNRG